MQKTAFDLKLKIRFELGPDEKIKARTKKARTTDETRERCFLVDRRKKPANKADAAPDALIREVLYFFLVPFRILKTK